MKIIIIKEFPYALAILKKVDAESLGPSPKFQVNIEIQLNKLLKDQAILDITQCYLNIIYVRQFFLVQARRSNICYLI